MVTRSWTRRNSGIALALLALTPLSLAAQEGFKGGHKEALGKSYESAIDADSITSLLDSRARPTNTTERVRYWNGVAVDASGLDHTPVGPNEARLFGEQLGPARASRAMAIVHLAMFDSLNATTPRSRYRSFTGFRSAPRGASADTAVAQAAHDALLALFPSQGRRLDAVLEEDLARIRGSKSSKLLGSQVGMRVAELILARRAADGAQHAEPRVGDEFPVGQGPGEWRPDPISQGPLALGAYWGEVEPLAIDLVTRFRPPPPPALRSSEYAQVFEEALQLGGDGVQRPTLRTADQTIAGTYWAYDGTPSLCAPPRLFNQILLHIAQQQNTTDALQLLRLLTLANVAMADATTVAWEAKYHYNYWRPITAIREADAGTGPGGLGDDNPATQGDGEFMPLGAPASNLLGPNFTPPFPAYPSGHATMGGAMFQVLRRFYGTDLIPFTFVSDELNGVTVDNHGAVRPVVPRSFSSLSQAEHENGMSRVYLGIHWRFDSDAGIRSGNRVGDYVFDHALRELR
jgi:membrane-associated phospholipid phosphatase